MRSSRRAKKADATKSASLSEEELQAIEKVKRINEKIQKLHEEKKKASPMKKYNTPRVGSPSQKKRLKNSSRSVLEEDKKDVSMTQKTKKQQVFHHSDLDYIFAEVSNSPYLTPPLVKYSRKTINTSSKLRKLKFAHKGKQLRDIQDSPCDVEKCEEVFEKIYYYQARFDVHEEEKNMPLQYVEPQDPLYIPSVHDPPRPGFVVYPNKYKPLKGHTGKISNTQPYLLFDPNVKYEAPPDSNGILTMVDYRRYLRQLNGQVEAPKRLKTIVRQLSTPNPIVKLNRSSSTRTVFQQGDESDELPSPTQSVSSRPNSALQLDPIDDPPPPSMRPLTSPMESPIASRLRRQGSGTLQAHTCRAGPEHFLSQKAVEKSYKKFIRAFSKDGIDGEDEIMSRQGSFSRQNSNATSHGLLSRQNSNATSHGLLSRQNSNKSMNSQFANSRSFQQLDISSEDRNDALQKGEDAFETKSSPRGRDLRLDRPVMKSKSKSKLHDESIVLNDSTNKSEPKVRQDSFGRGKKLSFKEDSMSKDSNSCNKDSKSRQGSFRDDKMSKSDSKEEKQKENSDRYERKSSSKSDNRLATEISDVSDKSEAQVEAKTSPTSSIDKQQSVSKCMLEPDEKSTEEGSKEVECFDGPEERERVDSEKRTDSAVEDMKDTNHCEEEHPSESEGNVKSDEKREEKPLKEDSLTRNNDNHNIDDDGIEVTRANDDHNIDDDGNEVTIDNDDHNIDEEGDAAGGKAEEKEEKEEKEEYTSGRLESRPGSKGGSGELQSTAVKSVDEHQVDPPERFSESTDSKRAELKVDTHEEDADLSIYQDDDDFESCTSQKIADNQDKKVSDLLSPLSMRGHTDFSDAMSFQNLNDESARISRASEKEARRDSIEEVGAEEGAEEGRVVEKEVDGYDYDEEEFEPLSAQNSPEKEKPKPPVASAIASSDGNSREIEMGNKENEINDIYDLSDDDD